MVDLEITHFYVQCISQFVRSKNLLSDYLYFSFFKFLSDVLARSLIGKLVMLHRSFCRMPDAK